MTTVTIAWIMTSLSFIGCGVFALHRRSKPKTRLSDIKFDAPPPPETSLSKSIGVNKELIERIKSMSFTAKDFANEIKGKPQSITILSIYGTIGIWHIKYCTCTKENYHIECEVCRKKRERIENEFIEIVSNVASSCGVTDDELKSLKRLIPPTDYTKGRNGYEMLAKDKRGLYVNAPNYPIDAKDYDFAKNYLNL